MIAALKGAIKLCMDSCKGGLLLSLLTPAIVLSCNRWQEEARVTVAEVKCGKQYSTLSNILAYVLL